VQAQPNTKKATKNQQQPTKTTRIQPNTNEQQQTPTTNKETQRTTGTASKNNQA